MTASQAIAIHGWWCPNRILSWSHICPKVETTLAQLLAVGISEPDLYHLQPHVKEWIKHKGVSFADVPRMLRWPLHPLDDLEGDLSHLMLAQYDARVLQRLGITYETLVELEMSWVHMPLFHYTLQDWVLLGFAPRHVDSIPAGQCQTIFGVEIGGIGDAIREVQQS